MDNQKFDKLTRALAGGASRRSVLKGLLGIGVTASVSTRIADDVDARRSSFSRSSSTTSTTPAPCPDGALPCSTNSTGCCADCEDGLHQCGYDCCETEAQCCDGECCAANSICIAEETCCRSDLVCDTATTKCCADGEQCCTRDGVSYCIPAGGCCFTEDCPISDNQCLDPICPVGIWECEALSKPDETPCDDGTACTTGDRCIDGECLSTGDLQCLPTNDCFEVTGCNPATGCEESYRGDGIECDTGICFNDACCTPLSVEEACGTQCGGTADRGCGLTAECGAGTCEHADCVQLMDSGKYVCRASYNCFSTIFNCDSETYCSPGICAEGRCIMCESNENCSRSGANTACATIVSQPNACEGNVACVAP